MKDVCADNPNPVNTDEEKKKNLFKDLRAKDRIALGREIIKKKSSGK
jgi:hypothetical protein